MLRKFLMFLIVLLLGLIVGSFFLPDRVLVERSIELKQKPAEVFSLLNGFQHYSEWSPWHDESMQYLPSGSERGRGAVLEWQSVHRGEGRLEITESIAWEKITTRMEFGGSGEVYSRFLFQRSSTGTTLRWQYESDLSNIENPLYRHAGRYLALMMDDWIIEDYDRGLLRIRQLADANSN
ncbi:MAG: SRPBCC family protein [Xanthomonadales bacterium]|nr:SRPBCC family protein [Xanthomonadales bacterium]